MTLVAIHLHTGVTVLAFFQGTQLSLFEQFLTQAISGINSTGITTGMQNVAYVVLLVGFLWEVYQSALHGGDVRGLGTNLIKYVVTALVVMNYNSVFTTVNQGFVNAGNWISNATGAGNLFDNWKTDIQTQFNQAGVQQLWGLITGSIAGLLDGVLIIVAYVLYPVVIVIFGFFYIFYGSILYLFGPIVIALMPLGATNRIAKSYVENVFIWNAWPVLYGGFGALLSAVQMGQVGQMLGQNDFLGGLGNVEGAALIGIASIIYSLAIAIIPFVAKRIVSGDVGATAAAVVGAAATAITAGAAAVEGVGAGVAAAGTSGASSTGGGHAVPVTQTGTAKSPASIGAGNQPATTQRAPTNAGPKAQAGGGSTHAPATKQDQSFAGSRDGETTAASIAEGMLSPHTSRPGGTSLGGGSGPTAESHAAEIRSGMMGAKRTTSGNGTTSPSKTRGPVDTAAAVPTASSGNSKTTSGRSDGRPSFRPNSPASWGAYHAARLAAYGMVSGGRAVGDAIGAVTGAATRPVETAGAFGMAAGRAAGSLVNAAESATRVAVNSVAQSVSHPVETVQKGAQKIGEVSEAVAASASGVANTAKESVDAAGTQFHSAYSGKRREMEREK